MVSHHERQAGSGPGTWTPAASIGFALFCLVAGVAVRPSFAVPDHRATASLRHCLGGDEITAFVCRNAWVAGHKRNFR